MEHVHMLAGDLRYSARRLAKAPSFVLAALLAIVLGVSATTIVFSLLNAVLLRSLPYGNANRLVYMWTPSPIIAGIPRERQPFYADMVAWSKLSHSFESVTAMQRYMAFLNDGSPQRVGAAKVLGNFFQTLEASPQLGRTIEGGDDLPGRQSVAVISDRLWHSRFGGDPAALDKSIHIDGQSYRVIGVMAKEFSYPHGNDFPGQYQFASLPRTDVWVPAALSPKQRADREFDDFDAAIGRLRQGVSLSHAQSEIAAIETRQNAFHAEGWRDLEVLLEPFVETAVGPVRPLLRLLMAAVLVVLLMACVNVASLLIARYANRIHELGVRAALGAERARLIRLLMTESIMLAVVGGAVAAIFSFVALRVVVKLNPADIPRFEEATLDSRVLLFGLLVSLGTGLASGILPARSASLVNVGEQLRQGGRAITRTSWRARNILIVAQIALSLVLLAGAGLLIRSYLIVQGEDKGFSPSTLTLSVVLNQQNQRSDQLRRELMDRIRVLPGVQAAGSIDDLPLSTYEDKGFLELEGYASELKQTTSVRETGGDYFRAMQIPLIAGRYLMDSDIAASPAAFPYAVVVTESFSRRYFPEHRNAVGHRLRINGSRWATIVGVVGDVRHSSLEEAPEPIIYCQNGLADSVAIRTNGPPDAIVPSIRTAASALNAGIAVTDIKTMDQYVDQAGAHRRFQTLALTSFAGLAMLLTLVGLYGLLSYAVRQRTAEIGVRMAMGASRRAILGMIVSYGLKLTSAGLAIGLCSALALTRAMASFLYGVHADDPRTFIAVSALIIAVALIACIAPAWRAARIEPLSALRHQ